MSEFELLIRRLHCPTCTRVGPDFKRSFAATTTIHRVQIPRPANHEKDKCLFKVGPFKTPTKLSTLRLPIPTMNCTSHVRIDACSSMCANLINRLPSLYLSLSQSLSPDMSGLCCGRPCVIPALRYKITDPPLSQNGASVVVGTTPQQILWIGTTGRSGTFRKFGHEGAYLLTFSDHAVRQPLLSSF